MALAGVLVLIAVAAALFQFLSPWWPTPLASNWGLTDDTLVIASAITGVVLDASPRHGVRSAAAAAMVVAVACSS